MFSRGTELRFDQIPLEDIRFRKVDYVVKEIESFGLTVGTREKLSEKALRTNRGKRIASIRRGTYCLTKYGLRLPNVALLIE